MAAKECHFFLNLNLFNGRQRTPPITLNTVSRFRSEHTRHSSSEVVVAVGFGAKFSIFKLLIWDWLSAMDAVDADADAFAETCDVAADADPFKDIVAILPGRSISSVFRSL